MVHPEPKARKNDCPVKKAGYPVTKLMNKTLQTSYYYMG